ncbi:MAG: TlpA family protein disulfide reductase [Desulfuromonadaceae bacterium]
MQRNSVLKNVLLPMLMLLMVIPGLVFAAPMKGKKLPGFEATTIDGKKVSQASYAGKVVLIAVTSDACDACKKAAPMFNELTKKYEKQGFQMLGLHYGTKYGIEDLKRLIKDYNIGFTMALIEEKVVKNTLGIFSVPCYVVLNKKGTIAGVYRGYNEVNYQLMENQVKNSLAE